MKVLDLFAGLEGWSEPARAWGWDVCSVDIDPAFGCDLTADILELDAMDLPWHPDVILASPPCETFSQLSVRHHWTRDHLPKTEKAAIHYKLVDKTLSLIEDLAPPYGWLIENPRAKLRSMPLMRSLPRTTVWYCQYGMPVAKPTDLFGAVPQWIPRPECHNGNPDHLAAPRGSKTGIQGDLFATPADRAKVPYQLSSAVLQGALFQQYEDAVRKEYQRLTKSLVLNP